MITDSIMVIKFEGGYRLVRNHRLVEVWQQGDKLAQFETWHQAFAFLDAHVGKAAQPLTQH